MSESNDSSELRQRKSTDEGQTTSNLSVGVTSQPSEDLKACPMTGKTGKCPVSGMFAAAGGGESGSSSSTCATEGSGEKKDPFSKDSKKISGTAATASGGSAMGDVGSGFLYYEGILIFF